MSWNYRILDHGTHCALHEVFYTDEEPTGWTVEPVDFVCDTEEGPDGITKSLEMAIGDAVKWPVLKVSGDRLLPKPQRPLPRLDRNA